MQLVLSEARKQRSFREVWVGYLLAILLLSVFIYSDLGELRMNSSWFQIQQDIQVCGRLDRFFTCDWAVPADVL